MPVALVLGSATLESLWTRAQSLGAEAGGAALDLLLAMVVALIGWTLARLAGRATLFVLRAVRFNDGVRSVLGVSGRALRFEPAALASWAVYWTLVVLSVVLAGDALGLNLGVSVGDRLREVVPRVFAAALVLAAGLATAMALGALTQRLFESVGATRSRLRGRLVAAVLGGFAVLVALEQLGLAAQFIMALGITAMATAGLALGLAFGLGCRELARDFVVEYLRSLEDESPHRPT
jgi:hypothetical protein